MSARRRMGHQTVLAPQRGRSGLLSDGVVVQWVPFLWIRGSISQSCWGSSTITKVCNRTNGRKGRLMAHVR